MCKKLAALETTLKTLQSYTIKPDQVNGYLEAVGTSSISEPVRLDRLVTRPEVVLSDLLTYAGLRDELVVPIAGLERTEDLIEIELKYAGYLDREQAMADKMAQLEAWSIPPSFDFTQVTNITMEAREKLSKIRPNNLGQASRISGVSPADLSVLMVLLRRTPLPQQPDPVG